LKICHLTSVHQDGDIRIFHKECVSLSQQGFEVHFIVPNTESRLENGVHIHGFVGETLNRSVRIRKTVKEVLKVALAIEANLYHLHDPELLQIVSQLKKTGAKVVFDSHEDVPKQIMDKFWIPFFFRSILSKVYAKYEKRKAKSLDGIISVTPEICERFMQFHAQVCLVANYPLRHEFEDCNFNRKKSNHFCYVGGLYASRGIKEVVLAMEHVDATLHLAGRFDDPLLQKELEGTQGWKKIIYHGQVDRTAIQNILEQCSVGIVTLHPTPSYLEAYPIKLFEYMAAGCAVLASDFPLYRSLLGKTECARFVDPQSRNEITEALQVFIDNSEQTSSMGVEARKGFEFQYNWENEAEKLLLFYRKILKS
jgi:glycosyltransferase involved in cell wall biosynthesis